VTSRTAADVLHSRSNVSHGWMCTTLRYATVAGQVASVVHGTAPIESEQASDLSGAPPVGTTERGRCEAAQPSLSAVKFAIHCTLLVLYSYLAYVVLSIDWRLAMKVGSPGHCDIGAVIVVTRRRGTDKAPP